MCLRRPTWIDAHFNNTFVGGGHVGFPLHSQYSSVWIYVALRFCGCRFSFVGEIPIYTSFVRQRCVSSVFALPTRRCALLRFYSFSFHSCDFHQLRRNGADGVEIPHATQDLRNLKKSLQEGKHVAVRMQLETARIEQGHTGHRRRTTDGLVLSVIPLGAESNNLANHFGSEKFVYITRNASGRPIYASVADYHIPGPVPPLEGSPATEAIQAVNARDSSASFRGGFSAAIQIARRRVRHLYVLRNP